MSSISKRDQSAIRRLGILAGELAAESLQSDESERVFAARVDLMIGELQALFAALTVPK